MEPFDFRLVVERLRTDVKALQFVGGSADLAAVKTVTGFRTPSAFVVLPDEIATETPIGHATQGGQIRMAQVMVSRFGVTTAVRNYRYEKGKIREDDFSAIVGAIRKALIGWTPTIGMKPAQLQQGKIVHQEAEVLMWADIFTVTRIISIKRS